MALILVSDSESPIREVLEVMLTRMGHEVLACPGGEAALALLAQESVDLMITDVPAPHTHGIEVIRAVRHSRPELPVVVMSGGGRYDTRRLIESAGLEGAVSILEKPFERPDVARAMHEAWTRALCSRPAE